MAVRDSKYRRSEIQGLLELAGWEARVGSEGHIIMTKGEQRITLGSDPVHRNAVAEVQKALGIHLDEIPRARKGKNLSKAEIVNRILLFRRLSKAGFCAERAYRIARIGTIQDRVGTKAIREGDPHQIAEHLYEKRMEEKGVRVKHPEPTPAVTPEEVPVPLRPEDKDTEAVFDLLNEIAPRLEQLTRTDRLSLLGTYLDKLHRIQKDAHRMRDLLAEATGLAQDIVSILEEK